MEVSSGKAAFGRDITNQLGSPRPVQKPRVLASTNGASNANCLQPQVPKPFVGGADVGPVAASGATASDRIKQLLAQKQQEKKKIVEIVSGTDSVAPPTNGPLALTAVGPVATSTIVAGEMRTIYSTEPGALLNDNNELAVKEIDNAFGGEIVVSTRPSVSAAGPAFVPSCLTLTVSLPEPSALPLVEDMTIQDCVRELSSVYCMRDAETAAALEAIDGPTGRGYKPGQWSGGSGALANELGADAAMLAGRSASLLSPAQGKHPLVTGATPASTTQPADAEIRGTLSVISKKALDTLQQGSSLFDNHARRTNLGIDATVAWVSAADAVNAPSASSLAASGLGASRVSTVGGQASIGSVKLVLAVPESLQPRTLAFEVPRPGVHANDPMVGAAPARSGFAAFKQLLAASLPSAAGAVAASLQGALETAIGQGINVEDASGVAASTFISSLLSSHCRVWPHAHLTPAESEQRVSEMISKIKLESGYDFTFPVAALAQTRLGSAHVTLPAALRGSSSSGAGGGFGTSSRVTSNSSQMQEPPSTTKQLNFGVSSRISTVGGNSSIYDGSSFLSTPSKASTGSAGFNGAGSGLNTGKKAQTAAGQQRHSAMLMTPVVLKTSAVSHGGRNHGGAASSKSKGGKSIKFNVSSKNASRLFGSPTPKKAQNSAVSQNSLLSPVATLAAPQGSFTPHPSVQRALARFVSRFDLSRATGASPASFDREYHTQLLREMQKGLDAMVAQRREEEGYMLNVTRIKPHKHPQGGYYYLHVDSGHVVRPVDYEHLYLAEVNYGNELVVQAYIDEETHKAAELQSQRDAWTASQREFEEAKAVANKAARVSWWDQDVEEGLALEGMPALPSSAASPTAIVASTASAGASSPMTVASLLQRFVHTFIDAATTIRDQAVLAHEARQAALAIAEAEAAKAASVDASGAVDVNTSNSDTPLEMASIIDTTSASAASSLSSADLHLSSAINTSSVSAFSAGCGEIAGIVTISADGAACIEFSSLQEFICPGAASVIDAIDADLIGGWQPSASSSNGLHGCGVVMDEVSTAAAKAAFVTSFTDSVVTYLTTKGIRIIGAPAPAAAAPMVTTTGLADPVDPAFACATPPTPPVITSGVETAAVGVDAELEAAMSVSDAQLQQPSSMADEQEPTFDFVLSSGGSLDVQLHASDHVAIDIGASLSSSQISIQPSSVSSASSSSSAAQFDYSAGADINGRGEVGGGAADASDSMSINAVLNDAIESFNSIPAVTEPSAAAAGEDVAGDVKQQQQVLTGIALQMLPSSSSSKAISRISGTSSGARKSASKRAGADSKAAIIGISNVHDGVGIEMTPLTSIATQLSFGPSQGSVSPFAAAGKRSLDGGFADAEGSEIDPTDVISSSSSSFAPVSACDVSDYESFQDASDGTSDTDDEEEDECDSSDSFDEDEEDEEEEDTDTSPTADDIDAGIESLSAAFGSAHLNLLSAAPVPLPADLTDPAATTGIGAAPSSPQKGPKQLPASIMRVFSPQRNASNSSGSAPLSARKQQHLLAPITGETGNGVPASVVLGRTQAPKSMMQMLSPIAMGGAKTKSMLQTATDGAAATIAAAGTTSTAGSAASFTQRVAAALSLIDTFAEPVLNPSAVVGASARRPAPPPPAAGGTTTAWAPITMAAPPVIGQMIELARISNLGSTVSGKSPRTMPRPLSTANGAPGSSLLDPVFTLPAIPSAPSAPAPDSSAMSPLALRRAGSFGSGGVRSPRI